MKPNTNLRTPGYGIIGGEAEDILRKILNFSANLILINHILIKKKKGLIKFNFCPVVQWVNMIAKLNDQKHLGLIGLQLIFFFKNN